MYKEAFKDTPDHFTAALLIIRAMMTLVEELKAIIPRALPTISEAVQQLVIDRLLTSGLNSIEDLKYVQQEDIGDLLPVIQQRKLLDAFKMETETITLDLQVLPADSSCTTFQSIQFIFAVQLSIYWN
ncbi:uncharacterized protein LOC108442257 isoform X1 [Scomber scombrus]|uniref:Uncharacterized protein LOC108442257 isoform X1 n=1 Tax=Scomber scombrus TaxID=13677 RepID=A0AAV1Q1J9_SCOSC